MFNFYNPRKHKKTRGFLMFSGGIEVEIGWKWVKDEKEKEKQKYRMWCGSI